MIMARGPSPFRFLIAPLFSRTIRARIIITTAATRLAIDATPTHTST